jgi:ABC-type transporter Mla MlaB component
MKGILKITTVSRSAGEEVYALEGWITGEGVAVLAQTCGPPLERGANLVLDLHGVRTIDESGLALLMDWYGPRLALRRPSALIRLLLERRGLPCQGER